MAITISSTVRCLAVASLVALSSCSHTAPQVAAPDASRQALWLKDGMIAISRPVPTTAELSPVSLLGFMPAAPRTHAGSWVVIDRAAKNLTLMDGDRQVNTLSGEGVSGLKPGTYHIVHKQRNALWYAPDSYFSARDEVIPARGDKARFRRGALGEFVLYLDKDTPIHSGPVWSDEIGGARLSDNDISRLYYTVDIGSTVEIR